MQKIICMLFGHKWSMHFGVYEITGECLRCGENMNVDKETGKKYAKIKKQKKRKKSKSS